MQRRFVGVLAGTVALAAGAAALRPRLWERLLRLEPATHPVTVERGLRVPMADGVMLATDHYAPRGVERGPTILIRTPYGRANNGFAAQRFAERGYHVIAQDVRGRFGSEGTWEPYVHEAEDGEATIRWIGAQPWSDGQVGMWGASYLGYVQWAAASTQTPLLKAMVPVITQSNLVGRPEQGYRLDTVLRWLLLLDAMADPSLYPWQKLARATHAPTQNRLLRPGFTHLPLETADEVILGKQVPFFRTWNAQPEDAPFWASINFNAAVADVTAPVQLVGGWYDIFLEGLLDDYRTLAEAGRAPALTVGPWHHLDMRGTWESLRLALRWFDAHLKGRTQTQPEKPVRLYILGANRWHGIDRWPPEAESQHLFLREGGRLAPEPPTAATAADHYRYDPADPTPNVGGALLSSEAGPKDNRAVETRPDVLVYSSAVLEAGLTVVGPVRVTLWVESSLQHTDFVVRLTDVFPDGRSINVADGFLRLTPQAGASETDGPRQIEIVMAGMANHFAPGHRIRLRIASAAHPRIARNLGTGEPFLSATTMRVADQTIYRDATRPSGLTLPVVSLDGTT